MSPPRRLPGRPVDPVARAERSRAILAAARACVARKGFHGASVADISAAAGISIASLYQSFPSKDALILAIAEDETRASIALVGRLAGPGPFAERLRDVLDAIAEEARRADALALHLEIAAEALRSPRLAAMLRQAQEALLGALADTLAAAQARGELDPSLDPAGLARLLDIVADGLFAHVALGIGDGAAATAQLLRLLRL
ncbi:TetR/AcrR family transcriptional regulator [Elioraea sp.]|uniref:TetR/AcrR family transcriptional regulator n=1 Tax=Elioraea sp. TaxID=2185103 RepID=UPI0025BBF827|nr:TetR/AcrR family transcriptional regulator [Elioraea sp.]